MHCHIKTDVLNYQFQFIMQLFHLYAVGSTVGPVTPYGSQEELHGVTGEIQWKNH